MRLMQLRLPIRAVVPGSGGIARLITRPIINTGVAAVESHRYASVKAQGAYRVKNKKTLPKKMGAKRVGDQYVLPGTIIYKQRGTLWYAGENAILGRDHTIHAAIAGFVKYYRDPQQHPDRQYIGVTFDRGDALPHALHAARKRKLGMVAVPRKAAPTFELMTKSGIPRRVIRKAGVIEAQPESPVAMKATENLGAAAVKAAEQAAETAANAPGNERRETKAARAARRWNAYIRIKRSNRVLFVGKNYAYRESNFQIGRLMGTHKGKTPGTQRYGSRRAVLRHRRKKRDEQLRQTKELERQQRTMSADRSSKNASGSSKKKTEKKSGAKKAV